MNKEIRLRFAPSPTGHLHIGGARTALFNYLYAKQQSGKFILRIEDTDLARSTDESTKQILESLKWLGINYDEGPFYQTQRFDMYKKAVDKLLESGKAYKCFCSQERLEQLRSDAKENSTESVYDKKCADLSEEEIQNKIQNGEEYTVRFKSRSDKIILSDMILGDVEFDLSLIGDFIIARSDGTPVYNLTVVVDDAEMGITHVIRGNDHLSNTPKQIMLFEALGYDPPKYAHLPLILGQDKSRLSKRHGATSVLQFREDGYLPEAIINYLALLGWAYNDSQEIFSKEGLIKLFSLENVSKSSAVFDFDKLSWMNGYYMRDSAEEDVISKAEEYFNIYGHPMDNYDKNWLHGIIKLQIERSRTLKEMFENSQYFFEDEIKEFDEKGVKKFLSKEIINEIFPDVIILFEEIKEFSILNLETELRNLAEKKNLKLTNIVQPLRLALTGRTATPGIFEVIFYLGREKSINRLKKAQELFT